MTKLSLKQKAAVKQDRQLAETQETAMEALAEHRWHWTLDESNPDRMSFRGYAKAVECDETAIRRYANGYAEWMGADRDPHPLGQRSLNQCIEKASATADHNDVVEAVAEVNKISVATARSKNIPAIKDRAEAMAERENITLKDAAKEIATREKQTREMDERHRQNAKATTSVHYVTVSGALRKAAAHLRSAGEDMDGVAWKDDESELLTDLVGQLQTLVHLLELGLGGTPDIDWDAELASIGGES